MRQAFLQHPDRAIEKDERFEHVMALTLDPLSDYTRGIVRCITKREHGVGGPNSIDHSVLYHVEQETPGHFRITEPVTFAGQEGLIENLGRTLGLRHGFIGFEEPDIWIDIDGQYHVYFTIAFVIIKHGLSIRRSWNVSLGHAAGPDLHSLRVTEPVLRHRRGFFRKPSAKEVCIAPENSKGVRINLIESRHLVRTAIAQDMGKPWTFGPVAFDPHKNRIPWIATDASPAPLLPTSFIDVGPGRRLGIMNGHTKGSLDAYGTFSVGIFIYNYETGIIEWVSPEALIKDSEAKMITFASQFVETTPGEGILYAHVDDSFVRAYTLYAEGIKELLP